jgi:predicted transcriptional regulator
MPPAEHRNENGRFESEHGLTTGDVFEEMEPLEPYTTGELAEILDAPRRTVYNYLQELAEEDQIRKKKPEPRRAIWIRGA